MGKIPCAAFLPLSSILYYDPAALSGLLHPDLLRDALDQLLPVADYADELVAPRQMNQNIHSILDGSSV